LLCPDICHIGFTLPDLLILESLLFGITTGPCPREPPPYEDQRNTDLPGLVSANQQLELAEEARRRRDTTQDLETSGVATKRVWKIAGIMGGLLRPAKKTG
jgi:hypothetical protein